MREKDGLTWRSGRRISSGPRRPSSSASCVAVRSLSAPMRKVGGSCAAPGVRAGGGRRRANEESNMAYAKVSLAALNADAVIKLDNAIGEEIYVRVSGTFTGTLTPALSIDGTNYDATQLQPIVGGAAVSTVTAPAAVVPRPSVKWFG